jgi:2,4-dienoyl-CoA reductase-like NADH-dependent reductase (Old Yellow Enzyme family)
MGKHATFDYSTQKELENKIAELGLDIGFTDDLSILHKHIPVGNKIAPNAFACLPMEGCDSHADGSPSDLVKRRYHRFAAGGYGLIWWEACAVMEEGRANDRQMWLHRDNIQSFRTLLSDTKDQARKIHGHDTVNILQLTHSGRYARPFGHDARPIFAQHDKLLDPGVGLKGDEPVVSDEYLHALKIRFVDTAILAKEAGFDGVDIKACHRYLLNELLASHKRKGPYGGIFENRSRLLREIVGAVKDALGKDFIVACRFNVYDGHPYPNGFGVDQDNRQIPNLEEPLALVRMLTSLGVDLLASTAGNPYYSDPQVTRPFDQPTIGAPLPQEHPLESVDRLFSLTAAIQREAGDVPVIGSGYSWLRQFFPNTAAFNINRGACRFVGLGRSSIAYPNAPSDLKSQGRLDPNRCCITCSKCTQIMRDHGRTGCVIRDGKVYGPLYLEARNDAKARAKLS